MKLSEEIYAKMGLYSDEDLLNDSIKLIGKTLFVNCETNYPITINKGYKILTTACLGLALKIIDDNGNEDWYHADCFNGISQ